MDEMQKTAVITGASSGIGRATAIGFARKGYNVVLVARKESGLKEVAAECEAIDGVTALVVALDTSDDTAIHDLTNLAVATFGRIDVWVNNAAVYLMGKFEDTPLEDMRRLMEVNFFGYVHGSYAALTQFRTQGFGTLISVSSVNAAAPQPYVGIYSASKAAVRALNESLRMELELDGLADRIHVCTVMPASIDTNFFQNAANYTGKELKALEPVYDPEYVARHIVKLARFPKREVIVGPAGKMMAMQNMLMPRMYERQIGKFTQKDMLAGDAQAPSQGNLYDPEVSRESLRGGWRQERVRADYLNTTLAVGAVAAIGTGLLAYMLFKPSKDER